MYFEISRLFYFPPMSDFLSGLIYTVEIDVFWKRSVLKIDLPCKFRRGMLHNSSETRLIRASSQPVETVQ